MKFFSDKFVIIFLAIILISSIGFSFWKYLYLKDYIFTIETSCNPESEKCFYRNCEQEECPPNNYEYFKLFEINAKDFDQCDSNNNCKEFCIGGNSDCVEIICGESDSDICSQ